VDQLRHPIIDQSRYSLKEVAEKLRVSAITVYRWTRRPDGLRSVRFFGRRVVLAGDLQDFLERGCPSPGESSYEPRVTDGRAGA
jgi:hypothetical protein